LHAFAVFIAAAGIFYRAYPGLFDIDAQFHYKVARLIREHGPWVDISWLPYTVLGERGPDHQWLFHLLLAPLTLLGDDLRAVGLASAIVAAAMPAALVLLYKRAAIALPALFALLAVLASSALPARYLALRAQDLAVVFIVAALFCMAWRKTLWVGVVAFLFMESYHGAVILGLLLAADLAARWILERKIQTASITATAVGMAAGLLLQPWFPANVRYLLFHTVFKAAKGYPDLIGAEWLGIPVLDMLVESWPAHALLVSGVVAFVLARRSGAPRVGVDTLAFCAVAAVTLTMYHFAWRFVEYYTPLAVTASALLWRDALPHLSWNRARQFAFGTTLAALVAIGAWRGTTRLEENASLYPFERFANVMRYVDEHDPSPLVLNVNWADFQQLVYWSERGRFVAGLDGNYLLFGDLARFKAWYALSKSGETTGLAADVIATQARQAFGPCWVVVPKGFVGDPYRNTVQLLVHGAGARVALEDNDAVLLQLDAPVAK
ncbi:MAG TPA: hypothetical protein VGI57_00065, partial [Usitatibacter sp.]